jgi:hypothetical protein
MTRVTLLIAFLVVAACNAVPGASGTPGATTVPTSGPPASPTIVPTAPPTPSPSPTQSADPTVAVVKIEQKGGMLPPWETLRFYPSVALYADGRLITQGPQIDIYPGPALPNLQVTQLTQAGVQQVLDWAAEAGLQGPDRQLGELLLDAGQTVFTVVSAEGTHRTSVTDLSASDPEIGALRQFQDLMTNLRGFLGDDVVGDDQPYVFDRLRVISSEVDPANVVDPELSSTKEWPLDVPLAQLGKSISEPANYRCAEIAGDDLASLLPLLQQANELTMWQSEGTLYQLQLRPLLPDEEVCPEF